MLPCVISFWKFAFGYRRNVVCTGCVCLLQQSYSVGPQKCDVDTLYNTEMYSVGY
jgi:hypothetical protein